MVVLYYIALILMTFRCNIENKIRFLGQSNTQETLKRITKFYGLALTSFKFCTNYNAKVEGKFFAGS